MSGQDEPTGDQRRPPGIERLEAPGSDHSRPENFMYWRGDPEGSGKEFEDIMLRRVPSAVAYRFRGAAGARALTHAQYLSALVTLHEIMRRRADGGDTEAVSVLAELGLGTVSI